MNQKPSAADPMTTPSMQSPRHQEALLDQAVDETFPASDPIAPAVQARLEPADVSLDEKSDERSRFAERMRRATPSLIAIGTAAVALMAMRAIRNSRSAGRD